MSHFTIIRQRDYSPIETRVATKYALLNDTPVITSSLRDLVNYEEGFKTGNYLPVGTVEFVREAMRLSGITEPANITYPSVLRGYLKRNVETCLAGSVFRGFVKPISTKKFTGFVLDALADVDTLDEFTLEQSDKFLKMDDQELVWVSEIVEWNAEVRYYVLEGKILGWGRYDDGPDEWSEPPLEFVQEIVDTYESMSLNTPIAYSVDVGMLDGGEPALVECNDAWALGYYKGTLSEKRLYQNALGSLESTIFTKGVIMKVVVRHPKHEALNEDCFIVHFSYEHGDADAYTTSKTVLQSYSDEELIEYVEKFDEIASIIENARSGYEPIPSNFREMWSYRSVEIPIEYDCVYKNAEEYYAYPAIDRIEYYDDNGQLHYVTIETLRKES